MKHSDGRWCSCPFRVRVRVSGLPFRVRVGVGVRVSGLPFRVSGPA